MTPRRLVMAGALALCASASAGGAPDAVRGEQVYTRCMACHALAVDRVGPRHCGLFGRRAGSVPGFAYSPAMKNSRIVWNDRTLERFLTRPLNMVPGSTMTYDGVADPKDRADLIAYLKHVDDTPECGKQAPLKR
ncbi:c-type cytochrome [Piscinibacter sp.]|jgi:cytochrome c|uniref:c-type cytochrome n=1 Tax=Piscinibacter sp. TaxID=1903157 RepID=UPI00391EEC04